MGRTKGSKNGVSTTPGYVAKGQKARGRLVNGQYVYGNVTNPFIRKQLAEKAAKEGAKNNWQFMANRQAAVTGLPSGTRMAVTKRQADIRAQNKRGLSSERIALLKKLANERKANVSKNAEDINDQISAHRSRLQEIVANKMDKDRKAKIMKQQIKKAANLGAQNNWQQMANASAAGAIQGQRMKENKSRSTNGLNAAGWDEHDRRVYGKSLGDYMKKAADAYEAKVKYNKEKKKRKKKTLIIE